MTTTVLNNVFSLTDISYINELPEVLLAKSKIDLIENGKVVFDISLTETIRTALTTSFGLNLLEKNTIPLTWIKGDTATHIDTGFTEFKNTYLVYLNDSLGELIIDATVYPIIQNTGYVFSEEIAHKTQNTGIIPRLLVGPMNEFANSVGITGIFYYTNYADALAISQNYIAYSTFSLPYTIGSNLTGSIEPYTSWSIANGPPGVFNNGFDLGSNFGNQPYYLYPATNVVPCFLEGTHILSFINGKETYIPVETIQSGTLVKTGLNGYKKVQFIGKSTINNPNNEERFENRLYKCSTLNYSELTHDLYLTGHHSILVDTLTEIQKKQTIQHLGDIYVTDKKYRLVAFLDERAEPWNSSGIYTIWHFSLENDDYYMNYGIYANGGLLVETCSNRYMKELSNLKIV